jgi:hypothetical protein
MAQAPRKPNHASCLAEPISGDKQEHSNTCSSNNEALLSRREGTTAAAPATAAEASDTAEFYATSDDSEDSDDRIFSALDYIELHDGATRMKQSAFLLCDCLTMRQQMMRALSHSPIDGRHGGLASVGAVGTSGRGPNSQQRQQRRALQPTSNSLQVGRCMLCAVCTCSSCPVLAQSAVRVQH